MKIYFLLLLGAYLGGNLYIFIRAFRTFSFLPIAGKIVFAICFWLVALSLIMSFMIRGGGIPLWISNMLFQLGAIVLVFTLYMVLALLLVDLIRIFIDFKYGFYVAWLVTCGILIYGYYNYRHPKIYEIPISVEKPILGDSVRIVAVSDVHLGSRTGKSSLKKYVELINAQCPDVILIGGDLIDHHLAPLYQENMAEELAKLKAPLGIYMVPGNHEYISGIRGCERFLQQTPIQLLRDTVVTLPNGIQIIGRDDRANRRNRLSLEELVSKADLKKFTILVDHQPYELAEKDRLGMDLQFSGHTHHGQVWPISLLTDYLFEQSHGYRKWSHSHVYVSSGLSLWGPPFRIGTNSDIALFILR